MLIYILKSAACLAILLLFYKVFLENENMHVFKRFYLLGALLFAFIAPAIVFTEYIEVAPINYENLNDSPISYSNTPLNETPEPVDFSIILWVVYSVGVISFGIVFLKNLTHILKRIQRNPKYKESSFIHVLLHEKLPPHTFLKYIFLNKKKFEENTIPKEVLLHEKTHAREKHSLDVLFIEILQVLFWFNPMFYFYKKAIKLNHEFLADQAVLNTKIDTVTYQNTLLSFLSSKDDRKQQSMLSSAINYSSIKKRFTIMKTKTSKKAILIRSLLLLPLLAAMLYGFSESRVIVNSQFKPEVDKTINEKSIVQRKPSKKDLYYEKVTFKFRDSNKKVLFVRKYDELSEEHKSRLVEPIPSPSKNHPSRSQLNNWTTSNQFGVWLDDIQVENKVLNDYKPEDIYVYYLSKLEKNATNYGKHFFQINLYTKTSFSKILQKASEPLSKDTIIYLKAEYFNFNKNINQATKEEINEYNALAKKYNAMLEGDHFTIRMPDVGRIKELYNLMTETQRTNAEPFPDFPEPPAPPTPPNSPAQEEKIEIDLEMEIIEQEHAKEKHEIEMERLERYSHFPAPPNLAYIIDQKPITKELKKLIANFSKKKRLYQDAVKDYHNNGRGNANEIHSIYDDLLKSYNDYKIIAIEEGVFAQASPAFGRKIKLQAPIAPAKSPHLPVSPEIGDKAFAEKQIKEIVENQDPYDNLSMQIDSRTKKFSSNINSPYTPPKPQTPPKAKSYVNIPASPEATTNRLHEELKQKNSSSDIIAVQQSGNMFYISSPQEKLPPPPPPFKIPDEKVHSQELLDAFKKFDQEANTYIKAIENYRVNEIGSISKLQKLHTKTMEYYNTYRELGVQEGLFPNFSNKSKVFVNGSASKKLTMTSADIQNLKLTVEKGNITSFKIKIPNSPSLQIQSGGQLYPSMKKKISNSIISGMTIHLYDLKSDNPQYDYRPILIEVE